MPPPPLLLPLPPPPPPTPPLPQPPPLLLPLRPPPPPPGCILGAPWTRQPSSVALSVRMGEGDEGPARRERLWACVRRCVCAPRRARQPGRPAPPASRDGGRAGAGAERGQGASRQGGGAGEGEVGGLGRPPLPSGRGFHRHCVRLCRAARGLLAAALLIRGGHRRDAAPLAAAASARPPTPAPRSGSDPRRPPKLWAAGRVAGPRSCWKNEWG